MGIIKDRLERIKEEDRLRNMANAYSNRHFADLLEKRNVKIRPGDLSETLGIIENPLQDRLNEQSSTTEGISIPQQFQKLISDYQIAIRENKKEAVESAGRKVADFYETFGDQIRAAEVVDIKTEPSEKPVYPTIQVYGSLTDEEMAKRTLARLKSKKG